MKLMAMTELDREMILSERADARDAARERRRAELALKQAQEQQQRAAEKVHPRALSRAVSICCTQNGPLHGHAAKARNASLFCVVLSSVPARLCRTAQQLNRVLSQKGIMPKPTNFHFHAGCTHQSIHPSQGCQQSQRAVCAARCCADCSRQG
jgi:hypothetical protein